MIHTNEEAERIKAAEEKARQSRIARKNSARQKIEIRKEEQELKKQINGPLSP